MKKLLKIALATILVLAMADATTVLKGNGKTKGRIFIPVQGSGVTSFIGRTGAVIAAANDYAFSQLSGTLTLASQLPNANAWNFLVNNTTGAAAPAYFNLVDPSLVVYRERFCGSSGTGQKTVNWTGMSLNGVNSHGDNSTWTADCSGGGCSAAQKMLRPTDASGKNHPCGIQMSNDAVSGHDMQFTQNIPDENFRGDHYLGSLPFHGEFIMLPVQVTAVEFDVGYFGPPGDFIKVRFDTAAGDTTFMAQACASSSCTTANSVGPALAANKNIRISFDSSVAGTITVKVCQEASLDAGCDVSAGTPVTLNTHIPTTALAPLYYLLNRNASAHQIWAMYHGLVYSVTP